MLSGNTKRNKACFILIISAITLIGLALRIICCNWGNPLQLHPDEPTIIDQTIDMLRRHSWEANVFNRPDHFEIKCNAILFSLFSHIKYGMPAYEAFGVHKMAFYKLGRMYTAFFGTAMIPLVAVFVGQLLFTKVEKKHMQIAQIFAALLTCFSCIFIEHSAYATPDVVLAFFVLLFAYALLQFIKGSEKCILFAAGIIGIGITIKYPAAILCIPLAISVVYKYIKDKKPLKIVKTGLLCIAIVIAIVFIIAPNLFTNYEKAYNTFIGEARPTHLGADGLGFFGNLLYYAKQMIYDQGWLSLILTIIAIIYMLIVRDERWSVLLTGFVFWICMSLLSLHWQRWGTPMYIFYIVLSAIGVAGIFSFIDYCKEKNRRIRWLAAAGKYALLCAGTIWVVSLGLSGICFTISRTLPDVRNIALSYVKENNIVSDEAISEGYTPFYPAFSSDAVSFFILNNNSVKPKIEYAAKKYLITSDSFKSRYMNERSRYSDQCAFYDIIDSQYDIVYQINGNQGNYFNDLSEGLISNISKAISYLSRDKAYSGGEITIYRLNPRIVRLRNSETGKYLSSESADPSSRLLITDSPYNWILYDNVNDTLSLISLSSNMAVSLNPDEDFPATISMQEITGENCQQWAQVRKNQVNGFLQPNSFAISCINDIVCLSKYTGEPNQLWIIDES